MTAELDDLDAAYAEIRKEPYRFKWAGREWSLPHLGDLDFRLQMEIENWSTAGVDEVQHMFARILGDEQAAAWADVHVPTPVLMMMFDRWVKHSGAQPGEEPASSDSSGSTGGSSRRTSAGSTGSGSRSQSTAKKATPKKAPAKRAPRKKAPSAAELAKHADAEWIAKHQALAGSLPENSST
jgi:hypothetical protein